MRSFFVTGTDTGVGKTIVSCGLAAAFRQKQADIGVFKPFLSGVPRTHPQETMVFPTPVSVPVTKKLLICLNSALF
jgi:dethiobiotin synthetase